MAREALDEDEEYALSNAIDSDEDSQLLAAVTAAKPSAKSFRKHSTKRAQDQGASRDADEPRPLPPGTQSTGGQILKSQSKKTGRDPKPDPHSRSQGKEKGRPAAHTHQCAVGGE